MLFFDGQKFRGKAHDMKVLERWKHFADVQYSSGTEILFAKSTR
jgi:hypothetical protein